MTKSRAQPHQSNLTDTPRSAGSNTRLGRCYELAGIYVLEGDDGLTLVHGSIQGFGNPRLKHAWVELPSDCVWEPATNKKWSKRTFELVFNPVVDVKYDHPALARNTVLFEHWGPWDPAPQR